MEKCTARVVKLLPYLFKYMISATNYFQSGHQRLLLFQIYRTDHVRTAVSHNEGLVGLEFLVILMLVLVFGPQLGWDKYPVFADTVEIMVSVLLLGTREL